MRVEKWIRDIKRTFKMQMADEGGKMDLRHQKNP